MNHPDNWYAAEAANLGHPGYITLAEVRRAEARQAREAAATAVWAHHPHGPYYTSNGLSQYAVTREPGKRTWQVEAWPAGAVNRRYLRHLSGIRTLAEAKTLALAYPCSRCGLAQELTQMTPVLPERPGQRTGPRPAFRCLDTRACLAERARLTGKPEPDPIRLLAITPAGG